MIILEVYMDMKKIVFVTAFVCLLPHDIIAQDDMYFTPKKADKTETVQEQPKMYTGSFRNVDEYNRHGRFAGVSQEVDLDTLYSDVVFFDADTSTVAGDTILVSDVTDAADYAYDPSEDYEYSRRLSRYDDYYWHDPWYYGWYGYGPYWYGSPYWYAGWWYDPWYDPWFYGWHRPWGWYYSWYWPVSYHRPYYGVTGTSNHGRPYRHGSVGSGNFKGYRGTNNRVIVTITTAIITGQITATVSVATVRTILTGTIIKAVRRTTIRSVVIVAEAVSVVAARSEEAVAVAVLVDADDFINNVKSITK